MLRARVLAVALVLAVAACGGDSSTGPQAGPPSISLINGVSRPAGTVGSTVLIEGSNFGDAAHGKVLFTPAGGGSAVEATIANAATDWTNSVILTTVPTGTSSSSMVTVETAGGTSNGVSFALASAVAFSPSTIHWTLTSSLPQPLQGLGAAFIPGHSAGQAGLVFAVGGADSLGQPTAQVARAAVQQSGALSAWATLSGALPTAVAYPIVAAASPYTAPIDTGVAGYLYLMGGVGSSQSAGASVWFAKVAPDGTVGAWAAGPDLPAARHSGGAAVFRGYLYVVGGADATNTAAATVWRAKVQTDGSLGAWEMMPALPHGAAYLGVSNFGPYLFAAGGDSGTVAPLLSTTSGTETNAAYLARVSIKDGTISGSAWTPVSGMSKARSKHSLLVSGGALLASSGVYAGQAGSSENTYATVAPDGTISSWGGATGTNTIESVIGYALYNEAAVSFSDASGNGHVLVLGGADRAVPGKASKAVVYY